MSLAAMMAGGVTPPYTTTEYLALGGVTGSVTVPLGVTTVWFNARFPGAGPYFATVSGNRFSGAGGGGGALIDAARTVTPGAELSASVSNNGNGTFNYIVNSDVDGFCFSVVTAQPGSLGGTVHSFGGSGASFTVGATTYSGGLPGNGSAPGGDGTLTVLSTGGVVITGGGGGGGGTVSPFEDGTAGGGVPGLYPGFLSVNGWGGAGGGYFNGSGVSTPFPSATYTPAPSGFTPILTVSW